MTDYDVDIYVTGSNSRMMSSEISTYLTGRYIVFRIFPLSFSEYMIFRKEYAEVIDPRTELANYLQLGGFPAVHLQKYTPDEVCTIVKDIYNSTMFTDIVRRNQIRKVDQLERIIKFAFDRKALISFTAVPVSTDSVAAMLENIIYLELLRRGYEIYVGKLESAEIDFIGVKQENKLYIQVIQEIGSPETEKREYGRLLDIRDNYPKYVLRTDAFAGGNYEGIKTIHIADFLLSNEWYYQIIGLKQL